MRTIYGPIYTLRPYERGIQEQFGKYKRFMMPGLGFQVPFIDILRIRDVREHTMDINLQIEEMLAGHVGTEVCLDGADLP
jgi:regulator of protease activity HflC (stomatin/prohibitin superfamily)